MKSKSRAVLDGLLKRRDKLNERIKKQIYYTQNGCKHRATSIREAEYEPGDYIAPFRVCIDCGYAEDGWGCGYWKLGKISSCIQLKRDEALEYVVGHVLSQDELNGKRYK